MGDSARVRLIRAAQSDELREIFRQLADMEGPDGPRYPRRVLMDLAARIVGRAYEPMLLELCHLVRAALLAAARSAAGRGAEAGFEWLFWGVDEARAGAFRAAFSHLAPTRSSRCPYPATGGDPAGEAGPLAVGPEAVTLRYPEGGFEVRYGRMVGLAAMMELMLSALGYRALVAALDPLAAPDLRRGAVSRAAADLARRTYEWLGDHLPAAQAQRKFRALTAFLEEAHGSDFTENDIDDETVFRFWLAHAAPSADGGDDSERAATAHRDFRGFRTTFLAFLALVRVLEAGAELGRFERRVSIGSDREAGEVDPGADWAGPEGAAAEDDDPLDRLREEPAAAVKVLNRRETALLALAVGRIDGVRRLPLSYLRVECFSPVQNRLSQALRRGAGASELAALAAAGPDPGYPGHIEALEKIAGHLARAARACLYVVHRAAADRDGGSAEPARLDFRLLGEARRAFDGLNRAGFERSAPDDPRLACAHAALAERLPPVIERLGEVLRVFSSPEQWAAAETADRPVFAGAFTRLYGVDRAEITGPVPSSPVARSSGLSPGQGDRRTAGAPAPAGEPP